MPHSTQTRRAITPPEQQPMRVEQISSWSRHAAKHIVLILLSLLFLPLDTTILCLSYVLRSLKRPAIKRRRIRASPSFYPKTILVTGVGMTKGLCLARLVYEAGHNVIGADFQPKRLPVSGRLSCALKKFYSLSPPDDETGSAAYVHDLLAVVRREKVDLWISCSALASVMADAQVMEVIERRTSCRAIQFDTELTNTLHSKNSFIEHTIALGLNVPETFSVTSRAAIHKVLNNAPEGRQYILKAVELDYSRPALTILPRPSMSDTYQYVANLDISPTKPWVLQQYIRGGEYCTHSLVVHGEVKAFVACPSSGFLMHYEALPHDSALNQAMLHFAQEYAARTGKKMTGHFSLDFMVDEQASVKGVDTAVYSIECNTRAHTAVNLFRGKSQELVEAYLSALENDMDNVPNGHTHHIVTPRQPPPKCYWAGHDIVMLLLLPLYQFVTGVISLDSLLQNIRAFLRHVLFWKEGTYEFWDPLPWWWLYHVYIPGRLLIALWEGHRWGIFNISTTTMWT